MPAAKEVTGWEAGLSGDDQIRIALREIVRRVWLKFLAGCFARRMDAALFITTSRLTSEQRREAEANVTVAGGREEITRLSTLHHMKAFELFEEKQEPAASEDLDSEVD